MCPPFVQIEFLFKSKLNQLRLLLFWSMDDGTCPRRHHVTASCCFNSLPNSPKMGTSLTSSHQTKAIIQRTHATRTSTPRSIKKNSEKRTKARTWGRGDEHGRLGGAARPLLLPLRRRGAGRWRPSRRLRWRRPRRRDVAPWRSAGASGCPTATAGRAPPRCHRARSPACGSGFSPLSPFSRRAENTARALQFTFRD